MADARGSGQHRAMALHGFGRLHRVTVVATLAVAPLAAQPGSAAAGDVYVDDYCTVRDVQTPYQAYPDHDLTVLDWTYAVTRSYAPRDLVPASRAGFSGSSAPKLVRDDVIYDLAALRAAAAADGRQLQIQSAYRSYAAQVDTLAYWVSAMGYEAALRRSARPGHSEHQLGTTFDFTSGGIAPWNHADWAATPVGGWMAANAWRYGFVMSYPRGATASTCYDYEPWHYRWIGRDDAAAARTSGLTLREYLEARLDARFVDMRFTPFEADIEWVADRGITTGCAANRYCSGDGVTRGQMASFLVRAFGLGTTAAPDAFVDDESSIHEADINRLAAAGIASGCAANRFCPGSPVRRDEMASFIARALRLDGAAADHFIDDERNVHEPNIDRLAAAGVVAGCGARRFCPTAIVSRGEMAAFLHRAFS